ncbi:MAG: DEAD/DEAH box helicase [Flavobacteriales bacterium]|nr:DEAD/DEAH box helicase [Flavobacteriales bacterium]MCW8911909.1 DEAD/DEAH box helicase [Flavobacteriales bacterium]MCW8937369.1 DEAD/DEAH box helicase [Flavobacteriales bacterium]MCW8968958.1 DEAD/DEAH box helicase [Flavobacteriales bacterium]MCW8990051.1 DEAD/DEAH box helicase [Flavobacteriales bacterium]
MTFKELEVIEPILKALQEKGYTHPTPIQEQAIPILLKGKDLLGCAQTGTGKTAAFAIPILQHLYLDKTRNRNQRQIKALIVTPTRELAIQIADNFTEYGEHTDIRNTVIFGGIKQGSQTNALRRGVDVLVATPGRLLDLMNQGFISLKNVEYFVLDEADQMLDMGFVHDIKKLITKLPVKRQSLFFSATMPKTIVELSGKILGNYESVTVKPEQATAERVGQAVYFVSKADKTKLLVHVLKEENAVSTLVFARTKHGADKVVKVLSKAKITAEAIHGNKSQNARQRALSNFKEGKTKVLVATDIAARGIDISDLALVINYDLPNVPETYVHRIGRTGRASASGISISFCNIEERPYLKDIEKLIKQQIPVVSTHPYADASKEELIPDKKPQGNNGQKAKPKNNGNRNNWRGNKSKSSS